MPSRRKNGDFPAVFAALKRILEKYEGNKLAVLADKPDSYALESVSTSYRGKPLYFAGIQVRKKSVNFYLMPVYGSNSWMGYRPGSRPACKAKRALTSRPWIAICSKNWRTW
ncbi:MAG TPA: hypothetical protein VEV17_25485 [Bryobacteraceae bacterium]|nr:hypothetical protein [Bryobacteraceae bacterium]